MLVEESQVRSKLRRTVEGLACPAYLREDLEQEAIIHLWLTETDCPGKALSWYCEACCFHARHEAERGRSIDSPKRRHLGCQIEATDSGDEPEGDEFASAGGTPLEYCCALDILEQLASRLDPPVRKTLWLLLEGCGVREIAARARLSPGAVVKHCNRIVSIAKRLGIQPQSRIVKRRQGVRISR